MGRGASGTTVEATVQRRNGASSADPADRYEEFKREHLNVMYLTEDADVVAAAKYIKELNPKEVGLDIETASKAGRFGSFNGSIRTIQLGFEEPDRGIDPLQVLIDCHSCSPRPFLPLLRTRNVEKQIHYMDFEQEWAMLHLGISIGQVYDTCIAGQVIQKKLKAMPLEEAQGLLPGWEPHNNKLSTLTSRYMGLELPKENQVSDWGREVLTADQKIYAAMDVATLPGPGGLARQMKEIAEAVGVSSDIDSRIAWVRTKIAERVAKAKDAKNDDAKRLSRALKRARTKDELDRLFLASKSMTLLADNSPAFTDLYRERRKELVT